MFSVTEKIRQFACRHYIVVSLPYREARQLFEAKTYSAATNEGQQREGVPFHVKSIRNDIKNGKFTPVTITVAIAVPNNPEIKFDNEFTLNIAEGQKLPLLDGGHRFAALEELRLDASLQESVDSYDITAIVVLDGSPKLDFVNLQKGRPVDKAHLHSLSVQEKLVKHRDRDAIAFAY